MRSNPKSLLRRAAACVVVLHAWLLLPVNAQVTNNKAEALGLKLEDKSNVSVPGGTIELGFANGLSFSLPGVEIVNQRVRT